jgi:CHASE1-domain containing sensor protein
MMDEATGLLADSRAGYAPLSKAISLLEEASGLWPENAEIVLLIEQTIKRMAEMALQLSDLSLAEAMAARLTNDDARQQLEEACASERRIRNQRERQRRVSLVAAGIFAALTVIIGLGWLAYRMESQRRSAELAFTQRTAEARAALTSKLDHHLETVRSVALLFTIHPDVTRRDFSVFVTPIVERHPGIYALEWCPMITHDQRAAYEAAFAAENLGNTHIIEPDASGNLVRAPDRDVYFPVHYAEPLEVNLPIMGLNAVFSPERRRAFDDARDRASDVASSRITLVEETGDEFAVLVAVPSYRDGMPLNTPLDRRAAFQGFSLALWRMGDLLQAALKGQASARSTYLLWDASARAGEELLATFRPNEAAPPAEQTAGVISRREPVSFAGRSWVLEVREWPE